MLNRNVELKRKKGKIPYWMIAEKLSIHENTIVRWFRQELSDKKKERISQAIKEVKQELKCTEK